MAEKTFTWTLETETPDNEDWFDQQVRTSKIRVVARQALEEWLSRNVK